jgi:hypothetical protein
MTAISKRKEKAFIVKSQVLNTAGKSEIRSAHFNRDITISIIL